MNLFKDARQTGWNREVLAETIIKLRSQGAGVIVMPILFSEEDRMGGDFDEEEG